MLISPVGSTFWLNGRDAENQDDLVTLDDQLVDDFNGQTAEGTWTLVVQDDEEDEVGTLDTWSLALTTDCAFPTS